MHRSGILALSLIALVLAGCSKYSDETPAPSPPPPPGAAAPASMEAGRGIVDKAIAGGERQQQLMAYSHSLWLITESETVLAHFERARDRCLREAALNCVLVSGTANAGDEMARQAPSAQLVVTLPHDQVALFQKGLRSALPGRAADVAVRSQNVEAENVTQQVVDIDQRVAQLTSYRDRLTAIAGRPNIKAEDLIPLEEKISELQSTLDQLATQKAAIGDRVRQERVAVTFTARATVSETARPVAQAWDKSFELLGESASAVILFVVLILPWLPVAAVIWLIVWLVRRNARRRREREAASKAAAAPLPAVSGS